MRCKDCGRACPCQLKEVLASILALQKNGLSPRRLLPLPIGAEPGLAADTTILRGLLEWLPLDPTAAPTHADARWYHAAYARAIDAIARETKADVRSSPGISVKLSALHQRRETTHRSTVMAKPLPWARALARQVARVGIGFNIDAEGQDRLELSLGVIEALLDDPQRTGWDGFGAVRCRSTAAVPRR